jgi:RHS repeat-associated protein
MQQQQQNNRDSFFLKDWSENYYGYSYGFQGSEKDDEVKGEGNSYTTHFRQLDVRIGRWLTIDPRVKELPWQSPYCSMDNNPIRFNDPKGDIIPIVWAIG